MTFSNISTKDINREARGRLSKKLSDKIFSLIESPDLEPEIDKKITKYGEILKGLDKKALGPLIRKITNVHTSLIESPKEKGDETEEKLKNYTKYELMLEKIQSTPVNKGARTNPNSSRGDCKS